MRLKFRGSVSDDGYLEADVALNRRAQGQPGLYNNRETTRLIAKNFSGVIGLPATDACMERAHSFYIDESGHAGDVASARSLAFASQPVFALGCIGTDDPQALAHELDRLRLAYRCGPGELKSDIARLAPFVGELAQYCARQDCPVFIEVVDRRYYIAVHVVNHLLCGGLGTDAIPADMRVAVAEFLTDEPAGDILLSYLALCRDPSIEAVKACLNELWEWLDRSDDEVARIAQFLTMEARDRALVGDADPKKFLPLPDRMASDRQVWMLPNLSSLTNIYARINRSLAGDLTGVSLVHDDQLQYGAILEHAKNLMEELAAQNQAPVVPFGDYRIVAKADLRFSTWKSDPCLQAADLIAGCAMRFARNASSARGRVDRGLRHAHLGLLALSDPWRATGINFVFTDKALARMRVPTF